MPAGFRLRPDRLLYPLLAVACIASVWAIVVSGSIPAFQQDWTWPLSRGLSLQWLHAFIGLWDERGLGQGNPLPWQTYAVVAQVASILVLGPSLGLAFCIAALEFLAGYGCVRMLKAFGVDSPVAQLAAAIFYAFGPVVLTRIAAGHLAYLVAYALLPIAVELGRRLFAERNWATCAPLGIILGLSASQIQFFAITPIALLLLAAFGPRSRGWIARLIVALIVGVAIQLQALLPLIASSTPSHYFGERALLSWEFNNSSPLASAPIMLGYFTQYYESNALPWAFVVLYVLLAAALVLAIVAAYRRGLYALALAAIGTLFTAGLYGPLSVPLAWAFAHSAYFTVFRDLHYFAALTALGIALAIGLALQRFRFAVVPLFAVILWSVVPTLAASELRPLLVPRSAIDDTLADMRVVQARGPGRVLWLPTEEPVGIKGSSNTGRDFTAYGPSGNPSVSDDFQNPQLAYALATLRSGRPDWNAFSSMNVRYLVYRRYVRSARETDNIGTGFRLAYAKVGDAGLETLLARDRRLRLLQRSDGSDVYELADNEGATYLAAGDPNAMLYSALQPGTVALQDGPAALNLQPSTDTADPRLAWISGRMGWRYRAWLPDSIYPFVWTVSNVSLPIALPDSVRCVLAASQPRPSTLSLAGRPQTIAGAWRQYRIAPGARAGSFQPEANGVAAIADRACGLGGTNALHRALYVMASAYDAGWRANLEGVSKMPRLANGWMMAWSARLGIATYYLPARLQLIGFLIGLAVVLAALFFQRAPRLKSPE